MKKYSWLRFHGERLPGGHEKILDAVGIRDGEVEVTRYTIVGVENVLIAVSLPEGDERIPKLLALLKQHGEEPLEGGFDRYTDEELDEAPLLILFPNGEASLDGGSEFGTTYDLTGACRTCGAGARQTSPLILDGDPNRFWILTDHFAGCTYRNEIFVADDIATDLSTFAPSGLIIHDVFVRKPNKRRTKMRYKQIFSEHVLPPMSPLTQGVELTQPCATCKRSGHRKTAPTPRVVYRKKDIENARDINVTWEQAYPGELGEDPRKWRIPTPWLVVKPKAMQVLSAAGVTELDWLPIRVVDE